MQPGRNYGWPVIGFGVNYQTGLAIHAGTHREGMEQPAQMWVPSIGISGAMFYTGDRFPEWRGSLFVGGMARQRLVRLTLDGRRIVGEETLVPQMGRIRDVRQGPDGDIYLVTDNREGKPTPILRLEPVPGAGEVALQVGHVMADTIQRSPPASRAARPIGVGLAFTGILHVAVNRCTGRFLDRDWARGGLDTENDRVAGLLSNDPGSRACAGASRHRFDYRLMTLENPAFGGPVGLEALHSGLVCATEQDAVPPREHVEVLVVEPRVVDLRLRQQHGQLSLDRRQLSVVEQLASAKTGAIHHDPLRQRGDVRW